MHSPNAQLQPERPLVLLEFATADALWKASSSAIATGTLFVPLPYAPPPESSLLLELSGGNRRLPPIQGRVLAVSEGGFEARVTPGAGFKDAFRQGVRRRRLEKRARRANRKRVHPRYSVDLPVLFPELPGHEGGRARSLSHGGAFVCMTHPPAHGTKLRLTFTSPGGVQATGMGRVVYVVPEPEALARGVEAGAGIRFSRADERFLMHIGQVLADARRQPLRVLLVDDDDGFRDALAEGLRQAGMVVEEAATGVAALQRLVDNLFQLDLVLLDLRMPGLDGLGFLDRVRRLGGEMDLPIIVLSAAPPRELHSATGPSRANGALSKGEPLQEIIAHIKRVVGARSGSRWPGRSGIEPGFPAVL
jgi:two-component system OmpR family response regulator